MVVDASLFMTTADCEVASEQHPCPLWVISRHRSTSAPCPLSHQSGHPSARFARPLCTNSGSQLWIYSTPRLSHWLKTSGSRPPRSCAKRRAGPALNDPPQLSRLSCSPLPSPCKQFIVLVCSQYPWRSAVQDCHRPPFETEGLAPKQSRRHCPALRGGTTSGTTSSMTDPKPQGKRFSHVYIDRGKPDNDSPTMRRRLAALIPSLPDLKDFGAELPRELGVDVPSSQWGYYWMDFFRDCDLTVALETITIAWRFLKRKESTGLYDIRAQTLDCRDGAHL